MYGELQEFLNDVDQVFYNCRLYNGTESFVGKIGVDVNREYDNLLQAYGIKERFENQLDTNALIAELLGTQIYAEEPQQPSTQPTVGSSNHQVSTYEAYNNGVEAQNEEPMVTEQPEPLASSPAGDDAMVLDTAVDVQEKRQQQEAADLILQQNVEEHVAQEQDQVQGREPVTQHTEQS